MENDLLQLDRMVLVQEEPRGPSQLIEILIPANVTSTVALPLIQQLTSDTRKLIVIKSLRLVTVGEIPVAPVSGLPNAALTELVKIFFTIYAEGWEKGKLIPLLSLNNTFIEGSGIPYRSRTTKLANWDAVDWNLSNLIWANGTPSNGTAYAIIFEAEYERFSKDGQRIIGPS